MNDVLVTQLEQPPRERAHSTARREWVLAGFFAAAIVTIARLVSSLGRDEYAIWPDEPSQLAIARFIGGGTRWNMVDHSVWRPLFGTLLSPVYWVTDDPTTVFHTALVLNAVLGGIATALLVVIARRLTTMSPPWCAVLAVIVSLTPAAIFPTNFVFAESLLVPLYLATLLALFRLHAQPTLARGLLAGVLAAAAFATHSRMLPLAIIVIGVTLFAAARRRMASADAVGVVAVTVASLYLVSVYTAYVVDRLWNTPSDRNSIGGVTEQLTNGWAVAVAALGQTWYLLATTLGVIAYGAAVLVRSATATTTTTIDRSTRSAPRESHRTIRAPGVPEAGTERAQMLPSEPSGGPTAGDARVLLVTLVACVGLSIVFMSDRWRSDQLVYGRYNDAIIGPVLIVGLAALVGAVRLRRLSVMVAASALAIVASGSLLWMLRSTELAGDNGLEPMILGLQPFITSATSLDVLRISGWAALLTVALGAIAIAARRRRATKLVVVVLVLALVGVGWVRTRTIIDHYWDDARNGSAVEELRDGPLGDGVPVDFYLPPGSTSTSRMMLYQFHLPRTEFTVVRDPVARASSPLVFARVDDGLLMDAGAVLIWRDPRGRYGLWER